jgi:hypothetical protein
MPSSDDFMAPSNRVIAAECAHFTRIVELIRPSSALWTIAAKYPSIEHSEAAVIQEYLK